MPQFAESERENNFGLLRLLFASLVIVSHAPEQVDGNVSREILSRLFGTITFGEVAVDGFFLISGYLITKSFVQTRSIGRYLWKRVLRIVPGFAVAFGISVLVVAPLAGSPSWWPGIAVLERQFLSMVLLMPPHAPGAFAGLPSPALNAPLWTITYEFRCYLATLLLGVLGVFQPRLRAGLTALVLVLLLVNAANLLSGVRTPGMQYFGNLHHTARFFGVFGVGALYYLYADAIKYTHVGAAIAALALIPLLFLPAVAEMAFVVLGGYLIFWFAFRVRVLKMSFVDNRIDLSYGIYLYAWPIENLLIWHDRAIQPWVSGPITLACAAVCALVSWTLVERPCLQLAKRA